MRAAWLARIFLIAVSMATEAAAAGAGTPAEAKALSERIKETVAALGYSEKTATDFVKLVATWEAGDGGRAVSNWSARLDQARREFSEGTVSQREMVRTQIAVVKALNSTIKVEIGHHWKKGYSYLPDIIEHKKARSLGYVQVFTILGKSVGLSVEAIGVAYPLPNRQAVKPGHTACVVRLDDGRFVMVDLTFEPILSKPFDWGTAYRAAGNYLELTGRGRAPGMHRRIQLLDTNGLISRIYTSRGDFISTAGKHEKALKYYTKALSLTPANAVTYRTRAATYSLMGEYDKALADLKRALELDPEYADAYLAIGYVHNARGNQDKAIECYLKANELDPWYAAAYFNRGCIYGGANEDRKAFQCLHKAIDLDPEFVSAYVIRGYLYDREGEYAKALADFDKAIQLEPEHTDAYLSRGITYTNCGWTAKAAADFAKCIELDPDNPYPYYNRARLYILPGAMPPERRIEILDDVNKAIELDPTFVDAYMLKGNFFFRTQVYDLAIKEYTKAIALDPKYAKAYADRGGSHYELGSFAKAIPDLSKAIELDPNVANAYLYRGLGYVELGKYKEAVPDLGKAIQRNPRNPKLYYKQGICHAELGHEAEAARDLMKAVRLDPGWAGRAEAAAKKYGLELHFDDL